MDDEIKQLREKLETLERQKGDEDARNKDPFRHLRERIEEHAKKLTKMQGPGSHPERIEEHAKKLTKMQGPGSHPERIPELIQHTTRELECDKCVLHAILALQADVKALADMVAKLQGDAPEGYTGLEEDTYWRPR